MFLCCSGLGCCEYVYLEELKGSLYLLSRQRGCVEAAERVSKAASAQYIRDACRAVKCLVMLSYRETTSNEVTWMSALFSLYMTIPPEICTPQTNSLPRKARRMYVLKNSPSRRKNEHQPIVIGQPCDRLMLSGRAIHYIVCSLCKSIYSIVGQV